MASRVTPRASAASITLRRSTDISSDTSYTPAGPRIRLGSVHSSGTPRRPGDENPEPPTDRRRPGRTPWGSALLTVSVYLLQNCQGLASRQFLYFFTLGVRKSYSVITLPICL